MTKVDHGGQPPHAEPNDRAATALSAEDAVATLLAIHLDAGVDETLAEEPIDRTSAALLDNVAGKAAAPTARRSDGARATPSAAQVEAARAEELAESARASAAAAQDLPALARALSEFDGCALKQGAQKCVFADGDPAAELMVIGEGPGRDEDRAGLPFVGRSGRLLDAMLAAIGLDRRSADPKTGVYIANLVPWRPLENRAPDDREVTLLAPFLARQIQLAQPRVLLCLGGAPAKHLMGAASGVTRFRGSWTEVVCEDGRRIPSLATFHPAYLLRNPEMKRLAWRDLLALREKLDAL